MLSLLLVLTVPSLPTIITICILLAVVGFGVNMALKADINPAFKSAIQFVAIIGCLIYVLHAFGVV